MYASKTLIFKPCSPALASPSRKLCGIGVLVPDVFGGVNCTITLSNASPALFGEWKVVLHCGGKVYTRVLTRLFEYRFSLGAGSAKHIGAVSAIIVLDAGESRLLTAAFASTTAGDLNPAYWLIPYARNRDAQNSFAFVTSEEPPINTAQAALAPETDPVEPAGMSAAVHNAAPVAAQTPQPEPETEYERFVRSTDNFYAGETAAGEAVSMKDIGDGANFTSQNATINNYSRAFKSFFDAPKRSERYFNSVQGEIDEIFRRFPPYLPLCEKIQNSAWVRIQNAANDKYFLLGLVVIDETPAYICYALPAQAAGGGRQGAEFISLGGGEAYYILYQDAASGRIKRQ